MAAILREEPPELVPPGASAPPLLTALDRIVRHGLEKDPDARFQTARDLVFALEGAAVSGAVAPAAGASAVAHSGRRRWWSALVAAAAVALCVAAFRFGQWRATRPLPVFRSLTRERGTIGAARFVPGASDVAYSAQWGSGAPRLYVTRRDQIAPRLVPGFEGLLESVSPSGEVLGLTQTRLVRATTEGRLVSLPLAGGAARPWADRVLSASWGERGEAAVAGLSGAELRLEWPPGRVVAASPEMFRAVRVRGETVAWYEERTATVENGTIFVARKGGAAREVRAVDGFTGMAWGPDGTELWVSTSREGESRVEAVDLHGRSRPLLRHAGRLEIQDVDEAGGVLAAVHLTQRQVFGRARGKDRDEDLGWLDAQAVVGMTPDGGQVLLARLSEWNQVLGHLYLRPLEGGPAVDFGEGGRLHKLPTLSPDGRSIFTCTDEPSFGLRVLPTGPGTPRFVPTPSLAANDVRTFPLPDGRRAVSWVRRTGSLGPTFFLVDLETGAARQVAPDGANLSYLQSVVSPDGEWMAFTAPLKLGERRDELNAWVSRVDGRDLRAVPGIRLREVMSGWYRDSDHLVVVDRNVLPATVDVIEISSGNRTPLLRLLPPDPVGVTSVTGVMIAVDGGAWAYNVVRKLSELYLVEGLR